ncbi:D-aminoacyl-tRNA deacylase [Breznakiella homolactica]|uniref:D-aminoacyl-tRNA deacylase n=1 Tax=Breznakiella homolactica TaxID=2798577 RepID=A0A7T7XKW8_9SPIR|nr:D-aminoacyl-tRNA deacylase [Breznakiella homolactica]QQO08171.1 D-tyrosyl-tRNA(Tyr) deacylase [Breznakiella homolactica]
MRAVVQRVLNASVTVDGSCTGAVESGLLVYLGVAQGDTSGDADYLAEKISGLRIFEDDEGKMNRSVSDVKGGVLAVSQFTLLADARKGRRPSYSAAAAPDLANSLYSYFTEKIRSFGLVCETGKFQAHMLVSYTNDGPVTILLDSKKEF